MDTDEKIDFLKNVDLLNFYDRLTLEKVVTNCEEISLGTGEVLFEEGSLENAMYLILSGELIVSKGNKQIASLGAGQYLGEMSLIESKPRSASVKAIRDSVLLEIDETQFNQFLASEPKALLAMMRTLSGRIRNDLDKAVDEMQKLSIFAHDVRNNMTPLGLAEIVLMELFDKLKGTEPNQMIRDGLEEAEECYDVVTSVRDTVMAMLDASLNQVKKIKAPYIKRSENLENLVSDTVQGLGCHKNLMGKTIDIDAPAVLPHPACYAIDIKRVLQNLIINAGCVTEDSGSIRVSLREKDDTLEISVIDRGGGIPKEIRPFLLKESLTTKKDGNGLGLLSCKYIIEDLHQGRFWYDTELGKGTSFRFTLPLNVQATVIE